ncbi:MAG: NUDIX domain-containing protein [Clostridia bacterium]|nr:NUDIX domain-containing protein [Clostridia bacterium]
MEKWDILNADGAPTGKTTVRGHCNLKPGEYHLVVHIWVVSSHGEFLIQRRSETKKLMPGEWAATGGAAISGENSYTAANRELYEELGIPSNKQTLKKLARIKRRNSLLDIWFVNTDINANNLRLQKDEVAEARWVSRGEFEQMIREGQFHNYGKEYFDTIFQKIDEQLGVRV